MAKIFDKVRELMFGAYDGDDDDDEYEDDYDEQPEEESGYSPRDSSYGSRENTYHTREKDRDASYTSYGSTRGEREYEPTPIRKPSSNRNSNLYSINTQVQMQVVIIKPEKYEDAQDICDQIKTKRPVVVNLENVEFPTAQRIMDFLSGTCYSLEGSIQRVANNIFIIAPENVEVSSNFKEELKTTGVIHPWSNVVGR